MKLPLRRTLVLLNMAELLNGIRKKALRNFLHEALNNEDVENR